MNSRITVKDIVAMILIIVSFTTTGIMINNQDYKYALIALTFSAFCVFFAFLVMIIEDGDKILDLNNPALRNPRKSSGGGSRVTYIDRLTPEMLNGTKKTSTGKGKRLSGNDSSSDDFYESVGNMRVYKRGETIDTVEDDEDE